jgi:hypothetical protein
VLLCLWSPLPDSSLAGQEHGRTIPLGEFQRRQPPQRFAGLIAKTRRKACIRLSFFINVLVMTSSLKSRIHGLSCRGECLFLTREGA